MTQHQVKYTSEIKDLRKQAKAAANLHSQLEICERQMKEVALLICDKDDKIKLLSDELASLTQQNEILMRSIEEFEQLVDG
jgi:hypothetical protein